MANDFFADLDESESSSPFFSDLDQESSAGLRKLKKTARLGTQYGIGTAERLTAPYNLGAIGAKQFAKAAAPQEFRQNIFQDIETMLERKQMGDWSPQDERRLAEQIELIKNPRASKQFLENADYDADVGSLLEQGLGKLGINAKPEGVGEHLARFSALVNPKSIYNAGKKTAERISKIGTGEKVTEKFGSGLTKPRAVESKYASKGIITPAKQEKTISGLEKEAANLTKKSLEKHLPLSKQISEGFDFEKNFERGFGNLKKLAEKHNPEINISPLSKFLSETRSKYRGIPSLHPEAKVISAEAKAFSNRPETGLGNLLKIYRSNNRKMSQIFETSRVTGKQKELVDFLSGMNKKIEESFVKSLPKDSEWVKNFQETNANFKQYMNAKDSLSILEPIIGENLNPTAFRKFAMNPKAQAKLRIKMGEEGANEVIQVSKDLQTATDAIKKMPAKEFNKYDAIIPVSILIPYIGQTVGTAATLYKGIRSGQRLYGYYLSNPATRKVYSQALQAVSEGNLDSYKEAAKQLAQVTLKNPEPQQ